MSQTSKTPRGTDSPVPDDYVSRKLFNFSAIGHRIAATYWSLTGKERVATALDEPKRVPPGIETFPEYQPPADGTRILIAGTGAPLDRETMFHFLDEQRAAIPDMMLVHTRASGAESLADQWARDRGVPQIMYPVDPAGETEARRAARHQNVFDTSPPVHVYDFSETGRRSALSEIAYKEQVPVTVMRHLPRYANTGGILHDPIDRRPTTAPGIPATLGEKRQLAISDRQESLDELRARPSFAIHPLMMQDPRALPPTNVEGARPPFDGIYRVITGSETAPDRQDIFRYLDERFDPEEPDSRLLDLIIVHTGESPAEIVAGEWARQNFVPQIVYAPHPDGETIAQQSARIHTLLDHAGRDTIIDFSSPGETSDVVTVARNHHFIVSNAYHHVIEAPPIAEHPDLANTGSPILITGPGAAPNRQALNGLLDRVKRSFPDIVLVHTADAGAETIAQQWAKDRLVPQMVFPPDRLGETVEQRHARHAAILDNIDLVRIYDVSEPGNPSELAELARRRNLVVSDSRSAIEHTPAESLGHTQSQSIDAGSDRKITPDTGMSRSF